MNDGNPNGYYKLSFEGNKYATRFQADSKSTETQMRIVLEPSLIMAHNDHHKGLNNRGLLAAPSKVGVNEFDGGEFKPMQRVVRVDPYMERLFQKYRGTDMFENENTESLIFEIEGNDPYYSQSQ